MRTNEQLSASGHLKVFLDYEDGRRELHFESDNLIVHLGKTILLNQLYYSGGSGDPIRYAKFGSGGAVDPGGVYLKVPDVSLTDLYSPEGSVPVIRTQQDDTLLTITLLANIDNAVGNGIYINEAGFFSSTGKMFNIKVFPRILKTSGFSLNLEWVIRIS